MILFTLVLQNEEKKKENNADRKSKATENVEDRRKTGK
jgi:hypothetical protein